MAVAVRTVDLRKTYTSSPPLGAAGGFIARADARGSKQGKVQIAALDGLSLDVQPGQIFGLLGPNGAGKSTTIGVLTTRVRPTSGQAWIGDHEVRLSQDQITALVGRPANATPQQPVPASGRGTVLIASELLTGPTDYAASVYLHEMGNVLAYQTFTNLPYDARPWAVQPKNDWIRQHVDSDVGMALEECVYGGLYMGGGAVIP
jgi:energy-coupling factor transporter ATP-binding protein EcfA2